MPERRIRDRLRASYRRRTMQHCHSLRPADGESPASLFTEDGTYEDGFFGAHTGRSAIAVMLQRFHDTGRAYLWEFLDPLSDGSIGYARFRFSYASLLPEAAGRPVFFEGMSCFRFRM